MAQGGGEMTKSLKKTIRLLAYEIYRMSVHNYLATEPPGGKYGVILKIEEKLREFREEK